MGTEALPLLSPDRKGTGKNYNLAREKKGEEGAGDTIDEGSDFRLSATII